MTVDELLAAVNAAGITPDELTSTLKGGALNVRRTVLSLRSRAAREAGQKALTDAEAEAQALDAKIAALEAAQIAAIMEGE